MALPISRVYIIHTAVHEQERGAHIRQQVNALQLPYAFVMEGEATDVLQRNDIPAIKDKLLKQPGLASCSYKHYRACQLAVERKEACIMILENDIFFEPHWKSTLAKALHEIQQKKISGYVLSVEDSSLHYTPRSQRKPGEVVYPARHPRMAGAYVMDLAACKALVQYIETNGLYAEPDWHLHDAQQQGLLQMYWLHPAIAEQGSHNGRMQTAFNSKSKNRWNRFRWKFKKWYRKYILYNLR
jgi:glycosyl transferase, family 25